MGFLPKSVGSQSRFCLRDFLGEKSQISGIWELGSQKNPIPKPPLCIGSSQVRGDFEVLSRVVVFTWKSDLWFWHEYLAGGVCIRLKSPQFSLGRGPRGRRVGAQALVRRLQADRQRNPERNAHQTSRRRLGVFQPHPPIIHGQLQLALCQNPWLIVSHSTSDLWIFYAKSFWISILV